MSLKTYDRKGQVWYIEPLSVQFAMTLNREGPTTVFVLRTSHRVKSKKLIVYDVLVACDSKVWVATLTDNLKHRWEQTDRMHRLA